jgi:hypothetical protein
VSEKRYPWALRDIRQNISRVCNGFGKHELMQEENNRIFYQRMQNGYNKESLYILKLLPKPLKQTTKCHAVQVYVAIENIENLDAG